MMVKMQKSWTIQGPREPLKPADPLSLADLLEHYATQNHESSKLKPGQRKRVAKWVTRELMRIETLRGAVKMAAIKKLVRLTEPVPGIQVLPSEDGKSATLVKRGNS